jgi:hypothetical protein
MINSLQNIAKLMLYQFKTNSMDTNRIIHA